METTLVILGGITTLFEVQKQRTTRYSTLLITYLIRCIAPIIIAIVGYGILPLPHTEWNEDYQEYIKVRLPPLAHRQHANLTAYTLFLFAISELASCLPPSVHLENEQADPFFMTIGTLFKIAAHATSILALASHGDSTLPDDHQPTIGSGISFKALIVSGIFVAGLHSLILEPYFLHPSKENPLRPSPKREAPKEVDTDPDSPFVTIYLHLISLWLVLTLASLPHAIKATHQIIGVTCLLLRDLIELDAWTHTRRPRNMHIVDAIAKGVIFHIGLVMIAESGRD